MAQAHWLQRLAAGTAVLTLTACTHSSPTAHVASAIASPSPALSSQPPASPSPATSSQLPAPLSPAASSQQVAPSPVASSSVVVPPPLATHAAPGPCGSATSAHYTHVVWIWMENKEYGSVIGSQNAPYENALAKACGSATDYQGVTHPSLPNYLAATGGSTFGVSDDADPSAHPIAADSIFGQLTRAGLSWRSYQESMPTNCDATNSGSYAVKHNPAAYYVAVRAQCNVDDVPLAGHFDADLAAGALPSFSFVTPNLCNDTHDCAVRTGDTWLATWVPKIVGGANYQSGNTLVVVTWDEGVGANQQTPTLVVAPTVRPGTVATNRFSHFSLLRTTEDLLGLAHLSASATAPAMTAAFGL